MGFTDNLFMMKILPIPEVEPLLLDTDESFIKATTTHQQTGAGSFINMWGGLLGQGLGAITQGAVSGLTGATTAVSTPTHMLGVGDLTPGPAAAKPDLRTHAAMGALQHLATGGSLEGAVLAGGGAAAGAALAPAIQKSGILDVLTDLNNTVAQLQAVINLAKHMDPTSLLAPLEKEIKRFKDQCPIAVTEIESHLPALSSGALHAKVREIQNSIEPVLAPIEKAIDQYHNAFLTMGLGNLLPGHEQTAQHPMGMQPAMGMGMVAPMAQQAPAPSNTRSFGHVGLFGST